MDDEWIVEALEAFGYRPEILFRNQLFGRRGLDLISIVGESKSDRFNLRHDGFNAGDPAMFGPRTTHATLSGILIAAMNVSWAMPLRADGPSVATWGDFPNDVSNEIKIFAPIGIRALAVAPNMGFALVAADRRFVIRNVPPLFAQRLEEAVQGGRQVLSLAFSAEGGWAIVTDQGTHWQGINNGCINALNAARMRNERILSIALGRSGGWVVVTDREFYAGNLPPDVFDKLKKFAMGGGLRTVALSPAGGATVFANGTRYEALGVPIPCLDSIEKASVNNQSIDIVAFTKNGGWATITSRAR